MRRITLAPTEWEEQTAVVGWCEAMSASWPALKLLYHVPNGGSRHAAEARRLKLAGVKAGVPDLVLPVMRGGYGGLFIELKAGGGKPTPNQRWWRDRLSEEGYLSVVCWGAATAIALIAKYVKGELRRGE